MKLFLASELFPLLSSATFGGRAGAKNAAFVISPQAVRRVIMIRRSRVTLLVRVLFILALVGCLSGSALADGCPTITVDENGNGTLNFTTGGGCGAGVVVPTTGVLAADPGPGGLASVLTYSLLSPPSLVAGDVLLTDGGLPLDVIRFNPAGTGGPSYVASLLFYSDNIDGVDSLGDTPSPPSSFYRNNVSIPELGSETNNGAFYTPTAGQPGFVAGFTVTYDFISDGTGAPVPEPGTLMLLGTGLVGISGLFRRKAKGWV
jgi:hypothetical protein